MMQSTITLSFASSNSSNCTKNQKPKIQQLQCIAIETVAIETVAIETVPLTLIMLLILFGTTTEFKETSQIYM